MSAASLVMLSRESEPSSKRTSKNLRVNQPGDAFEREADRVAETVSSGGHIPGWSLASTGADQIQRDSNTASALASPQPIRQIGDPQDPPASNNYGDMLGKLAEAFLQTSAGKTIVKYLTDQPIVQDAKDFVQTPQGIVVAGSTAVAAITGLAAAHKGLPIQIPAIPLDKLHPGLKMKINVEGPLDRPTQGSLMFSFEGAPPKKKKGAPTDKERFQAETARMAEDQQRFRAGMAPHSQGPLASPAAQQQQADEQLARKAELRRLSNILQPGATHKPGEFTPLVPGTQPLSLHMRDTDRTPALDATKDKKEEIPIQRKAERVCYNEQEAAPEVESVISSSGRPLDRETCRYMESRIGFDFSKVRIHTDSRASASAKSLGARAYTVGNNVVFGQGRFAPNTTEGRRLLAHELTHVVQQGASPGKVATGRALPAVVTPAQRQIQRDPEEDSKGISIWDLTTDFRGTLKKVATKIPGYKLFTVIIAYDPLAGQEVTRNATNLVGEFLKLVGAEQTFKDLEAAHTLDQAFDWLSNEINKLNLTVQTLKDLITEAIKNGVASITSGVQAALRSVYETFKPTLTRIKDFAFNVLRKVGDFVLDGAIKLVDSTGILKTILAVGDVISAILKDPKTFVGNLIGALQKGFNQFGANIGEHLKNAVLKWLFGTLGNIQIPKEITIGSVFNLVVEVLGLDYKKNLRPKLVKELGDTAVTVIETTAGILKTIATQGLGAAWREIKEQAGDLLASFLSAAKDWAITTVVTVAAGKIVKLVAPGGAILEVITAIYSTLKVFIQKAKEIRDLIDAITKSMAKIVAGDITEAANYIEGVMAKAIPVMISFLADYLGLGDVAKAIRDILQKLRDQISLGIDKVFKFIIDKGKALLAAGKETVAKVLDWWKQRKEVTEGVEKHSIYVDGSEDQAKLMVASFPAISWNDFLDEKLKTATPVQKTGIGEIRVKATELEKRLPPSKNEDEKAANIEAKRKLFEEVAEKIAALGLHRDVKDPASVINYKPVRAEDEGASGAIASVLTPSHPPGSEPADEPKIWKSLGTLVGKKNYVQGHLLNENLGGPGRRFNLTPINKKANADHLSKIERTVKKAVNVDKKIMSYTVDVVYGSHPSKPKRMVELESLAANNNLGPGEPEELKEFQAEQKLCTQFQFEAHELEHNGTEWVPKKQSDAVFQGQVDNTIAP